MMISIFKRIYCAVFGHKPVPAKFTSSVFVKSQDKEWGRLSKTRRGVKCDRCDEIMEQLNISIIANEGDKTWNPQLENNQ